MEFAVSHVRLFSSLLHTDPSAMQWLSRLGNGSIYGVHDEIKDKDFHLFMSWVTKDTKGRHELVPEAVHAEAEKYAKVLSRAAANGGDGGAPCRVMLAGRGLHGERRLCC